MYQLSDRQNAQERIQLALLQDFDVFVAATENSLAEKILDDDTAWCGLERLLSGHKRTCMLSITPFQTTYIGVVPTQGYSLFKSGNSILALLPTLGLQLV